MTESAELTVVQRAAVALKSTQHEQELKALATKYADIKAIANTAGREQCHGAMMELANRRVAITKAGKEARDDATKFSKAVIEEEKRLVGLIEPEEDRLRALRDDWDADREREKAAKLEAERKRVNDIREAIDFIRAFATNSVGMPANKMAAMLETLEAEEITLARYQECAGEAEMVKAATVLKLSAMLIAQRDHEAEQARIAAERLELERLRAEQAERDRIAAEERAAEERRIAEARASEEARIKAERQAAEAKLRAEREAHEAELRRQREAEEARLRAEREAEEARLAEQRREIERQQAEIAAAKAEQDRKEREAREAAEAAARAEAERIAAEQAAIAQAEADRIFAEQQRIDAERRAAEAERLRRERENFELNGPDAREMVEVLAAHYRVEQGTVLGWINRWVWAEVEVAA